MTTQADINNVLPEMLKGINEEILATPEAELPNRFYFSYRPHESKTWNLYRFSKALEHYKRDCRKWEEHHNGGGCLVERVRDKYLLPKIKEFQANYEAQP